MQCERAPWSMDARWDCDDRTTVTRPVFFVQTLTDTLQPGTTGSAVIFVVFSLGLEREVVGGTGFVIERFLGAVGACSVTGIVIFILH